MVIMLGRSIALEARCGNLGGICRHLVLQLLVDAQVFGCCGLRA
jgi:hypothetical protein